MRVHQHTHRAAFCLLILLLGIAPVCRGQAATGRPPTTEEILQEARFDQLPGAQVPTDDVFIDDDGHPVHLRDYLHGQPVLLGLVYYNCPMLCTVVLNNAVESLRTVPLTPGKDFQVVFVSISPKETTKLAHDKKASYLKAYAKPGTPPEPDGWHFLTGPEPSIRKLADAIGYHYAYDGQTDQYAHPSGLVVLTPEGKVSRYFMGVNYDPQSLRLSLIEGGAGGIGERVVQVLLRCYQFNPSTGRYTIMVMSVMRILAGLTVALLGGGIGTLLWLERRGRVPLAARLPVPSTSEVQEVFPNLTPKALAGELPPRGVAPESSPGRTQP